MLQFLKRLFTRTQVDYKSLVKNGSVIIDVRTPSEFMLAHLHGSKNYPLNVLKKYIAELKGKGKPVIVVCASGTRSGMAKIMLQGEGIQVYNGGSWKSLKQKLS